MKTGIKIILAAIVFSAFCAGLMFSGILQNAPEMKNEDNHPEKMQFTGTVSGENVNIYAGSIGNITLNVTIPDSPASIPVYKGVFLAGDLVDEMPGEFHARNNVTSEKDAPEVAKQILENYGGLPSDAILTGAVTNYGELVNRTTLQIEETITLDTSVSWWRMVDGRPVVGDRDTIQVILGENGELVWIYKRWRTYTHTGNVSVIPFSKATVKLRDGEVLNPTLGIGEDAYVYSTILGYYAKGLENPEITLEPVWIFYGNTSSGSYLSFQIYARQFANFTATPISGKTPLSVNFTDTSDTSPTQWHWHFGDGTNSTDRNPAHTYNTAGTYNVSLRAWNDLGSDTMEKPFLVTVRDPAPPVANFTGTPETGPAPLTVSFNDTSSNIPTGWHWDFGDGANTTEQNPVHTYSAPGNYTVSLNATNEDGFNSITKPNYITVTNLPPTTITTQPTTTVTTTVTTTLTTIPTTTKPTPTPTKTQAPLSLVVPVAGILIIGMFYTRKLKK
ncbi:MAG: hypothetical protein CVV32_04710 [Methanomicrobiales archaeon HGW-Methanomicrobiales-3]|jgi:PKD repeat protein|nr:MAG: hypothetical protein CVV32_04710 [Methanomicrobiales archaeon HGW-Methanomicrobiales-3]